MEGLGWGKELLAVRAGDGAAATAATDEGAGEAGTEHVLLAQEDG